TVVLGRLAQYGQARLVVGGGVGGLDCGEHVPQVHLDGVRVEPVEAGTGLVEDELGLVVAGGLAQDPPQGGDVGADPVVGRVRGDIRVKVGGELLTGASTRMRGQ